jgi:hypothetical protein
MAQSRGSISNSAAANPQFLYLVAITKEGQMCTLPINLAALVALAFSGGSWAQSAPTLGLLYNTQEGHSLTYRCEPVKSGQLTCEFVQTAVRFKATYADLPAALEKARKQFGSEKPPSVQECSTYRDALAVFEGRKAAPKPEGLAAMSQVEKADGQRVAKALTEYCDKPAEEAFLSVVRVGHDKDRRTCSVSSNSYKQSFRLLSEPAGRSVWVAQSSPEGSCGLLQLSRFEPEETKIGNSTFTNWTYIARKAITNPSAEFFPGTKCSGLDERPYTYDWRSREHQMSCDYIQFSPL